LIGGRLEVSELRAAFRRLFLRYKLHPACLFMARFGHAAMSELSPLSGV
jgi:hypothetical protein